MVNSKYKFEDIEIGDEVYFDDVYHGKRLSQSNFDEYWSVHGKENNMILVNLNQQHHWALNINEVKYFTKKKLPPMKVS